MPDLTCAWQMLVLRWRTLQLLTLTLSWRWNRMAEVSRCSRLLICIRLGRTSICTWSLIWHVGPSVSPASTSIPIAEILGNTS